MSRILTYLALFCLALHPLAGALAADGHAHAGHGDGHAPVTSNGPHGSADHGSVDEHADCHEPPLAEAETDQASLCLDFCMYGVCCASTPLQASAPEGPEASFRHTPLVFSPLPPRPEDPLRPPILPVRV